MSQAIFCEKVTVGRPFFPFPTEMKAFLDYCLFNPEAQRSRHASSDCKAFGTRALKGDRRALWQRLRRCYRVVDVGVKVSSSSLLSPRESDKHGVRTSKAILAGWILETTVDDINPALPIIRNIP